MATAVSWLVGTVLTFLGFGVVICSALGAKKRAQFSIRFCCASLILLALSLGLAFGIDLHPERAFGFAWLALLLAALAVAPVFCYHTFARFKDSSDGDGGSGPGPPPPEPVLPGGGAPLGDADQARVRRRDHHRPRLGSVSRRRPAVEPARPLAPAEPARR